MAARKATASAPAPTVPTSNDGTWEVADILERLREPVDSELVKQRVGWSQGGQQKYVDYVEWHTVADILDDTFPEWKHRITDCRGIGQYLVVTVELDIAGITRQGMGLGKMDNEAGLKKAEHDALKRAAVKFGIARDLYKKDSEYHSDIVNASGFQGQNQSQQYSGGGYQQGQMPPNTQQGYAKPERPTNPVAQNLAEMVTTKQLGMIRAVAREANIDADAWVSQQLNCEISALTRRAASWVIDQLREGGQTPAPMQGQSQMPVQQYAGQPPQQQLPPPPPAQPASVAQGQMIEQTLINGLRYFCHHKGYGEEDIAMRYSNGRTKQISELSMAEGQQAHDDLAKL